MERYVKELYEKAIKLWTPEFQIMMLNEEMAELTIAINKMMRLKSNDTVVIDSKLRKIITEIADVKILLEQMQVLFKIKSTDLEEEYFNKLRKMEGMINADLKTQAKS